MARSASNPDHRADRPEGTGAPDELDERILRSLRQIIRSVGLYSKKLSREYTLTGPQLLCLRKLAESGPQSAGALAKAMSLSPATVTGVLDRLESRGLIGREHSTTDRRQIVISVTDAGKELAADAPPPLDKQFTSRLHALPLSSQERIAASLDEVVAMMEATDLDAAPILAPGAELEEPTDSAD